MKTIMTLTAVALISACSNAQLYDQIIRERDARMAAIPGEVHQEYVAKYGPDESKWPKRPNLKSTCETHYVSISGVGIGTGYVSQSGNVTIC